MQAAKTHNCISSSIAITNGVIQGSVLGPLLYINDITDITAVLCVNLKLLSDDAKLYSSFTYNSSCSADLMTASDNFKRMG